MWQELVHVAEHHTAIWFLVFFLGIYIGKEER